MSDTSPSKPPRTAPPEVRRRQLIDATVTSISQYGITGTTMAVVSRLSGLSMGLANFHFKSRDVLLSETLAFLAGELRERWQIRACRPDLSAETKLRAIVEAHFDPTICCRKKLAVWFAFFGEATHRESYRSLTGLIDIERLETSIDLCRQIIAEGKYTDVDPEEIGEAIEALLDGYWLNMLMYPARFTHTSSKAAVLDILFKKFSNKL